jgi:phospholipid transport system substrate-binding protein
MILRFLVALISLLAMSMSPVLQAQENQPEALVKSVTNDVLTALRTDKDIQSGNRRRAMQLIEDKVAPHFNFQRMTALAVGRNWRDASPSQQSALVEEFRTLLVRTYAKAMTAYRDQAVEFPPARSQPGDGDVTVRSHVKQPGGRPVTLDYSLAKADGGWKVHDVAIENISLVTNYREAFAAAVRIGGIDGLIQVLQAKNRVLDEVGVHDGAVVQVVAR